MHECNLDSLRLIYRGKVRDIYEVDDQHALIITTDRLSAFDVVLPDTIPGKGQVLTELSFFWFDRTKDVIPNHVSDLTIEDVLTDPKERQMVEGRSMVVRNLESLPVEAIVRGYLVGSGWKDYQREGSISGVKLPPRLAQWDKLSNSIFTPSTKADIGEHDENICFEDMVEILGTDLALQIRDTSLLLYDEAAAYAAERGIIIADTKFEFGLDDEGRLVLIDELLTPDSSRFWDASQYRNSQYVKSELGPSSLDKQFVRDYLETTSWNKKEPAPLLPTWTIQQTATRYQEIKDILIGEK